MSLAWDPVGGNCVAGYALYVGPTRGVYPSRIDVGTNTIVTITGLAQGVTNYFVTAAYNSAGVEGPPSNEATFLSTSNVATGTPQPLAITNVGQAKITAAAAPNLTYLLQSSTDLMTWSFVYTNQTGQPLKVVDTIPTNAAWRFYRALGVAGSVTTSNINSAVANHNYTPNAVGFVSILAAPGDTIISNPFDTGGNTLATLLPNVPNGTLLYKYTTGNGYTTNTFSSGVWNRGDTTLESGEAGFLHNPTSTNLWLVFAGELAQGTVTNAIPAGYSLTSPMVPQGNALATFPAVNGDQIQLYNSGKWTTYTYNSGKWSTHGKNSPLVLRPGGGFFITKNAPADWIQVFNPAN